MKKIIVTIIAGLFIIIAMSNYTYAVKKEVNVALIVNEDPGRKTTDVISSLHSLGYAGSSLYSGLMKIDTNITFEKREMQVIDDDDSSRAKQKEYYKVKIGEVSGIQLTSDQFKAFGGDKKEEGASWHIVIRVEYKRNEHGEVDNEDSLIQGYKIIAKEVYYDGETNGQPDPIPNDIPEFEGEELTNEDRKSQDEVKEEVLSVITNPIGTLQMWIATFFNFISDGIQMIANLPETIVEGTASDMKVTYTYDYLKNQSNYEKDGKIIDLNKYTNVSPIEDKVASINKLAEGKKIKTSIEKSENGDNTINTIVMPELTNSAAGSTKKTDQIVIDIPDNGEGYDADTEIPMFLMEISRVSLEKNPFFDGNFLVMKDYNDTEIETIIWTTIRNFVVIIIRIVIFITAAFLITNLILNGIKISSSTITPIEKTKALKGIEEFSISLILLVGTVVIMALCIYFNQAVLRIVGRDLMSDEFPIRLNVVGAGYSFSTNVSGYIRYLASIKNIDMASTKNFYSILSLGLSIGNAYLALLMLKRTLLMMIYGVAGPLIVTKRVLGIDKNSLITYRNWAIKYFKVAFTQVLFTIVYEIIFLAAIKIL